MSSPPRWGGITFSFLRIAFGAVSMGAKSPGIFLLCSAAAGPALGGTLVAMFMTLAFVGGIITTFEMKGAEVGHDTPAKAARRDWDQESGGRVDADAMIARYLQRQKAR